MKTPQQLQHKPVLLDAVLTLLSPRAGESYLDCTAGYGGHAGAVLKHTRAPESMTLVDRDDMAIAHLKRLKEFQGALFVHQDFASAAKRLYADGTQFDMILLDLGVSSPQFDIAERGFSFMYEAPLDMRMDQREKLSAQTVVNEMSEDELVRMIREYGEEPKAKRIASAIVASRPLYTTTQLADVIERTVPRRGKIHPATRTFQALRIAVNDELGQLQQTLEHVLSLLKPGGRAAVISFHSLEDRLVKDFFKEKSQPGYEQEMTLLTKRPISGSTEDVHNPRARSAKLRAAVKINIREERSTPHANQSEK